MLKSEFGDALSVYFIEKDFEHNIGKFKMSVDNLDKYVSIKYSPDELRDLLS